MFIINLDEEEDIHICILYQEGDVFFGQKATRSNRFYLITNPIGANLTYAESYHNTLDIFNKNKAIVKNHMFAGFQYSEALDRYDVKARFMQIGEIWRNLKEKDKNHTIHAELAHFNHYYTLHYAVKHLLAHVDSIGLNEQEIVSLIKQLIFYKDRESGNETDVTEILGPAKSKISVVESLQLLSSLIIEFISPKYSHISRIQYHTLGIMAT